MAIYDEGTGTIAHPVRYIRDSVNGSNKNTSSHWVEIQALDSSGNNIAKGKTVKLVSGTVESNYNNTAIVTDGSTATNPYLGVTGTSPTVEIDLGAVYDIANIKVWHYHGDGRTYNSPVTKVSSDGSNWTTISNGSTYAETSSGKTWSCSSVSSIQGLIKHEISKLYDYDGTTKHQIGKVCDYNGTTKSLIYSSEYLISDTSTNLWGTPAPYSANGNQAYSVSFDGGINLSTWSVWLDYRDGTFTCPNDVPTNGYKTLYITYTYSTSYGNGSDNVGININGTTIDRSFYGSKVSGTKTISYDVSNLATMKLSAYVQTTDPGGGSSMAITITKTWLE